MRTRWGIGIAIAAALLAALIALLRSGERARDERTVAKPTAAPPAPVTRARELPSPPATGPGPMRLMPATAREDDAAFGAFAGRVIDWGNGVPVAGADVSFASGDQVETVRTDGDGRFELVPSAPGTYRLATATADGYLPYAPAWGHSPIELTARPHLRVDDIVLYLTPALEYRGRVLAPDGAPVAGATVTLIDGGGAERALAPIRTRYESGADGWFTFSAPDDALLEARHPDYAPGAARVDGAVQVSHRIELRLRAPDDAPPPRTARIAGVVVDAAGAPIVEAMVIAAPAAAAPGDDPLRPALRAVSEADGRFVIDGADAGRYLVTASAHGYQPARAEVSGGAVDLRLQLATGARVAGRVVGPDGAPVPAFAIVVSRQRSPLVEDTVAQASVFDADGRFEVGGLPPGDYLVRAAAYGYPPSEPVAAAAVEPPAAPTEVELPLTAGGTLTGTVVDADTKAPLGAAKVLAEGRVGGGTSAQPVESVAITDDAGRFELRGLAPGARSVIAHAFDHHSRIVSGLQVTDGAVLGPITIELSPVREGERPTLELAGIGAALGAVDDGLQVQKVFDGSGAQEAGLVVGDVITAVDGASVLDTGFEGAIQRIRGPVDTTVVLRVRRGDGATADIVATRRKIRA